MKRIVALLLSLILFSTCMIPDAYATSSPDYKVYSTKYREYDAVKKLQSMTDSELKAQGLSPADIVMLRNFSFEEALLERASYSYSELLAMGYTSQQIALLKAYDGSPLNANSPVLAATATCTGSFSYVGYSTSTSTIKIRYNFTWSSVPFYGYTDAVGVSWRAVNPNAEVIVVQADYKSASINYYSTSTGAYKETRYPSGFSPITGFDGQYVQYSTKIDVDTQSDGTVAIWAKSGSVRLNLTPLGTNTINAVQVYGAVGHRVIAGTTSIGFSAGEDASFSFSYTPAIAFNNEGTASYTITSSGSCTPN